eukprot:8481220-Karenia_brevis.AAC.1
MLSDYNIQKENVVELKRVTLTDVLGEIRDLRKLVLKMCSASTQAQPARCMRPEPEDLDDALPLSEAAGSKAYVMGKVIRWRQDGGFGFVRVAQTDVFFHSSAVEGDIADLVGKSVYLQVDADVARGKGKYRARRLQREEDYRAMKAREQSVKAAAAAVRAAEAMRQQATRTRDAVEAAEMAEMRATVSRGKKKEKPEQPPGLEAAQGMPGLDVISP